MTGPKFYDPLTERWHKMPATPVIERPKHPTLAEQHQAAADQIFRVAKHAHVWDAIEATATATQTNVPCPNGSESDVSAS